MSASTGPESRGPSGEDQHHQPQLVRTLSLMDTIMVGIAGMIGGAIFVLTGPAIGLAGSAVILAFIINATITLLRQWHMQNLARQCRKSQCALVNIIQAIERSF